MARKILIISSDRSEKGLLQPIMDELEKRKDVEAKWFFPHIMHTVMLFPFIAFRSELQFFNPDIVLVACDRWEQLYATAYAFHNGYFLANLHAGNLGSDSPDEMNRRAISCFSHILLCNTQKDKVNLMRLGEEEFRCKVVGSTAFDHIEIDESLCPKEPYDLVLLHPDPLSEEQTKKDLDATLDEISSTALVYWLVPNRDKNYEIIQNCLDKAIHEDDQTKWKLYKPYIHVLGNLPRSQFLGLLKNCRRFLGNSSSQKYEAPRFLKAENIIEIGTRNLNRPAIVPQVGGSKRIAEILATIPLDDKLRRKRFVI